MTYNLSITELIKPEWTYEMVCDGFTLVSCTGKSIDIERCLEGGSGNLIDLLIRLAKKEITEEDYSQTSRQIFEVWISNEVEAFVKNHNQQVLSKTLSKELGAA